MYRTRAIVIGGSAGSIPVVRTILSALPSDYSLPIIICLHRMKNVPEGVKQVLDTSSQLPVREPEDKDPAPFILPLPIIIC
jgi:two-component system, chemotaxis family, protein-glutamate methylesterase/glutaminase